MLQQLLTEAATNSNNVASSIGPLLTGIAELLLALGGAIGFIVRYRQNTKREQERTRSAASIAAQQAADKLDQQYSERVHQYEETIERQQQSYDTQQKMYEEKLSNLQNLNTQLVNQILKARDGTPER